MTAYILGIDPGQVSDPTALALVEYDQPRGTYLVRGLHRLPLGTPYTELPTMLAATLATEPLLGRTAVAIDATGVGRPVIELVRDALPQKVYGITITSGTTQTGRQMNPGVPKRDLIATTSVVLEQHRMRIAADMRETEQLRDELLAYRRKTNEHGTTSYGAPPGVHDDLVLALSLALWTAEHRPQARRPGRTSSSPAKYRIPGVRVDPDPVIFRHR